MADHRDDVEFQILEHLRVLREEVTRLHSRLDRLERRLPDGPEAERRKPS
jgi:hypothetical protein